MLTIADLGILRDVTEDDQGRVHVTITPTYSGCPAMDAIRADLVDALTRRRLRATSTSSSCSSPAWTTDWMSEEGRRKLRDVRHRAAAAARGERPGAAHAVACAARSAARRDTRELEPLRLDRVQVAVGLQRLPRALRPLQGDLMSHAAPRRRSTRCGSRRSSALTDDAVAVTFEVPDELRDDYASRHGQHLTLRTELAGDDVRRNYSICAPAVVRGAADRRSSGCPAARSPSTRSTCCGSATCST